MTDKQIISDEQFIQVTDNQLVFNSFVNVSYKFCFSSINIMYNISRNVFYVMHLFKKKNNSYLMICSFYYILKNFQILYFFQDDNLTILLNICLKKLLEWDICVLY